MTTTRKTIGAVGPVVVALLATVARADEPRGAGAAAELRVVEMERDALVDQAGRLKAEAGMFEQTFAGKGWRELYANNVELAEFAAKARQAVTGMRSLAERVLDVTVRIPRFRTVVDAAVGDAERLVRGVEAERATATARIEAVDRAAEALAARARVVQAARDGRPVDLGALDDPRLKELLGRGAVRDAMGVLVGGRRELLLEREQTRRRAERLARTAEVYGTVREKVGRMAERLAGFDERIRGTRFRLRAAVEHFETDLADALALYRANGTAVRLGEAVVAIVGDLDGPIADFDRLVGDLEAFDLHAPIASVGPEAFAAVETEAAGDGKVLSLDEEFDALLGTGTAGGK